MSDRRYGPWSEARRDRHALACIKLTDETRLKRYKVMPNGCWEWQGALNSTGYGTVGVGSKRKGTNRTWLTHRLAYEIFVGPIPPGMNILHRCDNPSCLRPDHLFPGTDADNVADMMAKRRHNTIRGSKIGTSILDEKIVRKIKRLLGYRNDGILARQFKISDSTVSDIRHGRSWKHVYA